jgi:subtilase family serine protease
MPMKQVQPPTAEEPMSRTQSRPLLALAIALCALALAPLAAQAAAAPAKAPPKKPGELTVILGLRHPAGLGRLVREVSDPRSPQYREYLSIEQIVRRFGATPKAKRSTLLWLREHGARAKLGPTGTYVTAEVPATVAARALPAAGATASATGAIASGRRVPASLRGAVASVDLIGTDEGVFGTNVETAADKRPGQETGIKGTSFLLNKGTRKGCAAGTHVGEAPTIFGYTPNQYLTAYGQSDLQGRGYKGRGKNIAVIEIDGFRRSDVATFAKCFGVPMPKLKVHPIGIKKALPPGNETTLDLEVLAATTPKLNHIGVYEGGSSEYGILSSVAAALGHKGERPDAISISLGGCEAELAGQIAFREQLDEVFAVADAAGISVLVAAGDQGSTSCRLEFEETESALPILSASDPASSPYVTAVGGTNLELTKQNKIKREIVWNDSPLAFGGGGGALSILATPRPWWQRGILSGYGNGRLVPDVSGLADLIPGYAIYCTSPECKSEELPQGGWQTVGGTSAATPLYAGGVILADGYEAAHGAPPLGFLNPLVYEVGREARKGHVSGGNFLRDVTRGNNDLGVLTPEDAGGGHKLGCCSANRGYDVASGWGSLNLRTLAANALGRYALRPAPAPRPAATR